MASMILPLTFTIPKTIPSSNAFFRPLPISQSRITVGSKASAKFRVQASLKDKAVTGLTAAALTASMMVPQVAEAAESSVSPSLKNFLLSIAAGGAVLAAILGAIIGVANFDPVKRS